MSNPKETFYWTQLRCALTAGIWTSQTPGKAFKGENISWPELFRKFNKHCAGYRDIAEIALQTRTLALLLGSSLDEDHDDLDSKTTWLLSLGNTSTLLEEHKEEARSLYNALQKLESSNKDTLYFALAFFAYSLEDYQACIDYFNQVPDVLDISNHIPNSAAANVTDSLQLPAPSTHGSSSTSWTGSFVSDNTAIVSSNIPEISDGKAWSLTESIRGICLKGMSMEKLFPEAPHQALDVYNTALPLLIFATTQMQWTPVSGSGISTLSSSGNAAFLSTRELWRWVERLIWRAVVLSSKVHNVYDIDAKEELWTWLGQYSTCSVRWPPYFRPRHRSTVCALYSRALIVASSQYSSLKSNYDWSSTSRALVHEYRSILNASTKFPKAGERNVKVEDFVDTCVAIWEAGGSNNDQAAWVIDILWWATRLTFNCPRIFRHMCRLCCAFGDTNLARRFLALYVQVVGKQFQNREADVEIEGMETDEQWIDTLCQGARMLCRLASADREEIVEGPEAAGRPPTKLTVDDLKLARDLVEKARAKLGDRGLHLEEEAHEKWVLLRALVDLADGVANSVMALKEHDSLSRPRLLVQAHKNFLNAVSPPASSALFKPTASAHFHLALSHTRPGPMLNLDQAVVHAGLAVEEEPKEVRHWHLLGLVLSMKELWNEASDALERGAALGKKIFDENEGGAGPTNPQSNGVQSRDFGISTEKRSLSNPSEVNVAGPAVEAFITKSLITDEEISPAASLLRTLPDFPTPLKPEGLEHFLQIQMSQLALVEHIEGTDMAEAKGVEVFQWMSSTKRSTTPQRRSSLASKVSAIPSEVQLSEKTAILSNPQGNVDEVDRAHNPSMPPLINVRSASPDNTLPKNGAEDLRDLDDNDSELVVDGRDSSDTSRSKKVHQMLKDGVHKGQARIKKIGSEVAKTSHLKRSLSTPDFNALLRTTSYQASSIHSRRRVPSIARTIESPPRASPPVSTNRKASGYSSSEMRMLSSLWLMSAATFRRAGKIEHAKGAIQEAEVADESNPLVWDQLGLYYLTLGHDLHAVDAFQKALFIAPNCVPAVVHLAQTYLTRPGASRIKTDKIHPELIDLSAGMLAYSTSGPAWDVPEAWYYLAKAYELQGRKTKQRECLATALKLSESRGIREVGSALGYCL